MLKQDIKLVTKTLSQGLEVWQVIEGLPSKHKALSWNPSTTKNFPK
jgi:hypothetical protein